MDKYLSKYDTFSKTAIFAFTSQKGGLGDYLKFSIFLLDFCIKNDIRFKLYTDSRINDYIKTKYRQFYVDDMRDINNTWVRDIDYLYTKTDGTYVLYPSSMYRRDDKIYEVCNKWNFSDIFYFEDRVIMEAEKIRDKFNEYISIHLRMGDKFLETDAKYKSCPSDTRLFSETKLYEFINNNSNKNILFICDNYSYKTKLKEKFKFIKITDLIVGHTSYINTTDEQYLSCLVEFYLLTQSKEIYAASHSGFSTTASRFNNVPLKTI